MNSKQAKQLHLPQLLARLGHEPTAIKKDGNEYWYQSPFRKEKEASFHTSYLGGKWIWNDFGDKGGTVIDFVMRYYQFTRVSEVLHYLQTLYSNQVFKAPKEKFKAKKQTPLFSFQQQSGAARNFSADSELAFIKAHEIQHHAISAYLKKRCIPTSLSHRYLREIHYRHSKTGKEYFAFGMANEAGGYEIRAASDAYSFKSALIAKDITRIKGQQDEADAVNLFEGMLDFLSLLTMLNVSNLSGDSIIMHSLSSFQRCLTAIESMKYKKVNLFLDNNKAGQQQTEAFLKQLGSIAQSHSSLFAPYEDINDALQDNAIPNFSK